MEPTRNRLLGGLPLVDLERLLPHLDPVRLLVGDVVCESGAQMSHALFPSTAIISLQYMMENGASGYILKNSSKEELMSAIKAVNKGDTYFSGEAGEALTAYNRAAKTALPEISPREKEILGLIAEGYTNPQIAEKIFLSTFTVDSHRKNLLAKLQVKNTASLIKLAVENKLI